MKEEKKLSNYELKLMELVESGKKAFDLLIKEVERPIDEELQDDRARNAMKAKKECFMDAKEIITEVEKLEAYLNGEELPPDTEEEQVTFKKGYAEKFAKKRGA